MPSSKTGFKTKLNTDIKTFTKGIVNSYGQMFFSTKYWFSFLLILVSFFDPLAGLAGLISVISANGVALLFGYNKATILAGLYGFNALLVGLGLGIYFDLSLALVFILIISAIFTLFLSIMMEGVLYKYALPFLSIPFLLVIWTLNLAVNDFTALGLSERGLYTLNMLYANGGEDLVNIYQWWGTMVNFNVFTTYFISLGAIFFQYNVFAGILIATGLLLFSRIAFSLSVIGYFSAYFFYLLIGSDISNVSYMYIGFNYILTAIAIGGFFIIPSKTSYFWTIILIPMVAILTISLSHVFTVFGISMYSLPFNIIVLLFIYVLKFRWLTKTDLNPVVAQEYSPEKNLYSFNNYKNRLASLYEHVPIQLPFFGEWTVSQAFDGAYTHQDEWRHAWDFIIESPEGEQHKGEGNSVSDYFCYGKAILACGDGIVEEIVDGIADNEVGDINIEQNWGNTIVIRHTATLFSQISHIQEGSFKVTKGEYVKTGQQLANCGNSGRSPYPHLHLQFQTTPYVGSKTLKYPLASFYKQSLDGQELLNFSYPLLKDKVSRPVPEKILQDVFKFVPGHTLKWKDLKTAEIQKWDVKISALNLTYIECRESKAKAFFTATNDLFYFTGYEGKKKGALYTFYLSLQKVHMSFFENMVFEESIRPNDVYKGLRLCLQDFIAPFYLWLRPQYRITYHSSKTGFSSQNVRLETRVSSRTGKVFINAEFQINPKGIERMILEDHSLITIH